MCKKWNCIWKLTQGNRNYKICNKRDLEIWINLRCKNCMLDFKHFLSLVFYKGDETWFFSAENNVLNCSETCMDAFLKSGFLDLK